MERYISPEMDINVFAADDVVTASGGSGCSPVDININMPGCDFGDGLCPDNSCNDTCGIVDAW